MLKGSGLRYSGDEKDSPKQFLTRLRACRRATGLPDEQLLPCLASILVKDAGDWYEVYQDDIDLWDFATFERAFKRQFIGELHEDDVMEELRARYQGLKEKVAPFLTKFRRIIAHLKRPPSTRAQLNLAFSHLRPKYQDYLWDKRLDSFEAIERCGREFERREAIKESYHSPPCRDELRIPGTTYTGPHRSSHKAAAAEEYSSADDSSQSERGKQRKNKKKGRAKGVSEEVAAISNPAPPGMSAERVSRGMPNQPNRRPANAPASGRAPTGEGQRQTLASQSAPYSMSPNTPLPTTGRTGRGGI